MDFVIAIPESVLVRALHRAIQVLIARYDELKMRASGNWAEQLEYEIQQNKGIIKGEFYTEFLTKGRPPSQKMPPVSAIFQWMLDKPGFSGPKTLGRAFAIAKKIQKEGTSWYPQGSDLIEILDDPKVTDEYYDEVSKYLVVEISDILRRQILTLKS